MQFILLRKKKSKVCKIIDVQTGKVGTAKCHNDDNYDKNIGIAIAWCRLKNWDIPEMKDVEYKQVMTMTLKPNDKFYFDKDDLNECILINPIIELPVGVGNQKVFVSVFYEIENDIISWCEVRTYVDIEI